MGMYELLFFGNLRLALGSILRMAVHWWFPKWPSILKPSYPFLSSIEPLIPFIEFDVGFIFRCPCPLVKSCLPRILGKPFFGSWHSAKRKPSFVAFFITMFDHRKSIQSIRFRPFFSFSFVEKSPYLWNLQPSQPWIQPTALASLRCKGSLRMPQSLAMRSFRMLLDGYELGTRDLMGLFICQYDVNMMSI